MMPNHPLTSSGVIGAQVYELKITDHIDIADPTEFGIIAEKIDPRDYFVTSGDAVEKSKVLEHDMWNLAGKIRKQLIEAIAESKKCTIKKASQLYEKSVRPKALKQLSDYEKAVWKAAGQARKLVNVLKTIKGDNCFLETEWDDHSLYIITKNPRR